MKKALLAVVLTLVLAFCFAGQSSQANPLIGLAAAGVDPAGLELVGKDSKTEKATAPAKSKKAVKSEKAAEPAKEQKSVEPTKDKKSSDTTKAKKSGKSSKKKKKSTSTPAAK